MKISTEAKIGITGIIMIIVIVWGINFLKGKNIFSGNNQFVAFYNQVEGLQRSANVMLNGFKIGVVEDIVFDTEKEPHFTVKLDIEKKYTIRKQSQAEIYSADLLGSKAVRIVPSEISINAESGDTLIGAIETDMISSIIDELSPVTKKVESVITTLDSVGSAIHLLLSGPELNASLKNIEDLSASLKNQLSEKGDLGKALQNFEALSDSISSNAQSVNQTIHNLENITSDLSNADLDSLFADLNDVVLNLSDITNEIKSGRGSVGKFINEDSIYQQLNIFISDLDSLINDINENPKKYVQFSLF